MRTSYATRHKLILEDKKKVIYLVDMVSLIGLNKSTKERKSKSIESWLSKLVNSDMASK